MIRRVNSGRTAEATADQQSKVRINLENISGAVASPRAAAVRES
jgi:hypothetical protein